VWQATDATQNCLFLFFFVTPNSRARCCIAGIVRVALRLPTTVLLPSRRLAFSALQATLATQRESKRWHRHLTSARSCFGRSVRKMSAADRNCQHNPDDSQQQLQQQIVLLNQRVRILEGECKELDKARTAEKAQRERCVRSATAAACLLTIRSPGVLSWLQRYPNLKRSYESALPI
jgi:hypothetical protein